MFNYKLVHFHLSVLAVAFNMFIHYYTGGCGHWNYGHKCTDNSGYEGCADPCMTGTIDGWTYVDCDNMEDEDGCEYSIVLLSQTSTPIMLCCVVLCCVLYCIVLYCIVLYCIVLYCAVQPMVTLVYCSIAFCPIIHSHTNQLYI